MSAVYQFMVDFTFTTNPSEEFFDLIPYQRNVINRFFSEGKLVTYALSIERAKLWSIFVAASEMEVMEMIAGLPLTKFMQVEISRLDMYNVPTSHAADFSLN